MATFQSMEVKVTSKKEILKKKEKEKKVLST